MDSVDPTTLALAIIRHYGKKRALMVADRFAVDRATSGDGEGRKKWAAAAAWIAEMLDQDRKFRPPLS